MFKVVGLPALAWTAFVTFNLYFFLRKHLCTNCPFYGKECYAGWGLLASRLFEKGSGDFELGKKLAIITWSIFLILPILFAIAGRAWLFLIMWLAASAYVSSEHFSFCRTCPLREKCLS